MLIELVCTLLLLIFFVLVKLYVLPQREIARLCSQSPSFIPLFVPLLGLLQLIIDSLKFHQNVNWWIEDITAKHPQMDLYVTNIMQHTVVSLVSHKYVKGFMNNQNAFKKIENLFQQTVVFVILFFFFIFEGWVAYIEWENCSIYKNAHGKTF